MLGYLFVKYQTECRDSIQRSFFVTKPNEGIMLCESKDALTELQARRKVAEDKEVKL